MRARRPRGRPALQVEDVESVRDRGRDPSEFGDACAGPLRLARTLRARRQAEEDPVRRQLAAVIGAIRRGQVEHERRNPAIDEQGRSLAREVGRGRRAAVCPVRAFAACRPHDERSGRRPPVFIKGFAQRCSSHQAIAGLWHRITVFGRLRRIRKRDRDEERELEAARQPFADRDAIPGDVADAFGVRAIAMRRQSQDLAIAAAA